MNIRLSRNQVRFRISPEELLRLLKGESVEEITCFPGSMALCYRVDATPDEALPIKTPLRLRWKDNRLSLAVATSALGALAQRLPSRDGIESQEPSAQLGATLQYSLEVDIKS